jgi:hypothetical protein
MTFITISSSNTNPLLNSSITIITLTYPSKAPSNISKWPNNMQVQIITSNMLMLCKDTNKFQQDMLTDKLCIIHSINNNILKRQITILHKRIHKDRSQRLLQ